MRILASCGCNESYEKLRWYYILLNYVCLLLSWSALLQEKLADRRLLSEALCHPLVGVLIKDVIMLVVDYIGRAFSVFLRCICLARSFFAFFRCFYFNLYFFYYCYRRRCCCCCSCCCCCCCCCCFNCCCWCCCCCWISFSFQTLIVLNCYQNSLIFWWFL